MPGRLTQRLRDHWLHLGVCLLLVAVSFFQRLGETTFDTKFDLTADPVAALARSLTLWNTRIDFGGLANQGYGYLFPQGSWFVLTDLLAVPDWVSQRLWSALVLLVAYDGARRLARALGLDQHPVPVIAGLAYALTPRLIGLSGALTGEILPTAVIPWVCLPVVLALQGRLSARRGAVLSGLAVLCMGGVNAAENLATLPLPFLLVASGLRSRAGRRFALRWSGCVALACLWWMLPLLLLGRYSPPFLDYIETARATTRVGGWSNVVRGAEHWVNYIFVGGEPYWHAANAMSTSTPLVIAAALVGAIGLAGLFHRDMPMRVPLGLSVLVGFLCVTVGHGGAAGTPLAATVRELLDGPLAPFRNVHKFDPLVRLPLALGVAHAGVVLVRMLTRSSRLREGAAQWGLTVPRLRMTALSAVVVVLLASVAPVFAGNLRQPGWDRVPAAWEQAADWLDRDGPGATLVLPATGFGQQVWGWTSDEPIQGLTDSAWVARSQIPLVPPSSIRFLDGIEHRLEDGTGSPALAATLAAAGVTRVLVRNDVDLRAADVADPARVVAALANSPGLEPVKSFGGEESGNQPLIEIYRVARATGEPETTDRDTIPLLTGAPEDVMTAKEAGLVPAGSRVRVGVASEGDEPDVVTDGYRRIVRQFGRFHDAASQVMTRHEDYRGGRKVSDFEGVDGVPRVYAEYSTLRSVTASSSDGYADAVGQVRAELGPASAVDGDPATYWRSASFQRANGQWIQLNLKKPRPIGRVSVLLGTDGFVGAPVTRVEVSVGDDRRQLSVDRKSGRVVANFNRRVAGDVRVTVLRAGGNNPDAPVAVREIDVQDLEVQRSLVVPDVGAGGRTSFAFTSESPRRACVATPLGPVCDAYSARPGAEQGHVNRTFTLHSSGSWTLSGQAVAMSNESSARSLLPLGDAVSATADSVLAKDPSVSGVFAMDGRTDTAWLSSLGDDSPTLQLTWDKPRRLTRLEVQGASIPSRVPYEAVIEAGGETRVVSTRGGQTGYFPPLVASSAKITFRAHPDATGAQLPVGVSEVRIGGLEGLVRGVPLDWDFASECGLGPDVRVNGVVHPTRVSGTLRDVVAGRPVPWTVCGGPVAMTAGEQDVSVVATDVFAPTTVSLKSQASRVTADASRPLSGDLTVSDSMRLRVAPGQEAVLSFGQNLNPGWQATLAGKELAPTPVDGWQQGFVVPAGDGGEVAIDFGPGTAYRVALGLGGAAVLLLLLLLALDLRRPAPLERVVPPGPAPRRMLQAGVLVGAVLVALLGGPVLLLATGLGVALFRLGRGSTPALGLGAVCVLASGIAAVYSPRLGSGSPTDLANVIAAVGAGLLLATLTAMPSRESHDDAG